MIDVNCAWCNKKLRKSLRKKKVHNWFCNNECKNSYKTEYGNIKCNCYFCKKEFSRSISHIKSKKVFCSKKCKDNFKGLKLSRSEINCDNCKTKFTNYNYRINTNHNNFCSRKCFNEFKLKNKFEYYKNYRFKALEYYEHKCSCCGYDKILNVLEVHHIDKNRKNHEINNLIILCANCHAIITRKFGELTKDRKLEIF